MATTSSVSAVAGPLASIFATNDGFINRSIGGLTEDDLWHRPTDQSNPMFWLLGHVVHTRGAALRILGDDFRTGWGDNQRGGAADRSACPSFPRSAAAATRVNSSAPQVWRRSRTNTARSLVKCHHCRCGRSRIVALSTAEAYVGQLA
jgi:hypothetical protein